jgi:hypothetical protein
VPSQGSLAGGVLSSGSLQDMPGLQDGGAYSAYSLQEDDDAYRLQATGRTRRRQHRLQARLMTTQQ